MHMTATDDLHNQIGALEADLAKRQVELATKTAELSKCREERVNLEVTHAIIKEANNNQRKTIHQLEAERDTANRKFMDVMGKLMDARKRITTLEAGLERYAQHDEYDCEEECQRRSVETRLTDTKKPCTCGLTNLLNNAPPTP